MALKSELHYLHHPPHPHHHHHHLLLFLPNITSLTDDQLSISSTNYSVISPVNSVNSTTLPPLEVVLLRALLAQLLLGLAVNLALLASVVAANRSQSGPPYAHRQSLYASVASGAGRGAHLTAHRQTPVVDQILGLFAATAILRLLARAGLQMFCFYYGKSVINVISATEFNYCAESFVIGMGSENRQLSLPVQCTVYTLVLAYF